MVGFKPGFGDGPDAGGLDVERMLSAPRHAYILHGIEPDSDIGNSELAEAALKSADIVIAMTPFAGEALLDCADVVLPTAAFAETSGTFVNAEGCWQPFAAAVKPFGDARPAWRVLRVLADTLGAAGCAYQNVDELRAEIDSAVERPAGDNSGGEVEELEPVSVEIDLDSLDLPIYSIDPLVRRSAPLQQTKMAREHAEAEALQEETA
jgi:NADH-quinone oxidoreductase subunit G